jgi:hypothetical protein
VHGQLEPRARADRRCRRVDVEAAVVVPHVDDDGAPACLNDRLERRDERHRRHDHLVARLEAAREQAEAERVDSAREPDGGTPAARGGKRALELVDGGTVDERAALDQPCDVVPDRRRDCCVRGAEVDERDGERPLTVVRGCRNSRLHYDSFALDRTCTYRRESTRTRAAAAL